MAEADAAKPSKDEGCAPPWIFGITNIPFGVAGTYTGVAMPFLLAKSGIPINTIGAISALSLVPAAWQLLWAPILDLGIRRRSWLVLCSFAGSLCLASTLLLKLPQDLELYKGLMVLGQGLVGLVASCNGALVSTRVDPDKRGRAAGYINAANLGASALGGGLVLTLVKTASNEVAALALVAMITLPALFALFIPEPAPIKQPLLKHLAEMAKEVWKAVKSRKGWTGLCFCISPVGTVALTNLLSGMGKSYGVSDETVTMVNGYGGGFVTAAGALLSGFILDRTDRRKFYLLTGVMTAVVCIAVALAPQNPTTYVVGSMAYLAVAGLAYASFSAVVYEIVGTAGKTASTLYSVFPAAGNQAISYTVYLDGLAGGKGNTRQVFWADAGLNIIGVIALLSLMRLVFPSKKEEGDAAVNPEQLPEPKDEIEERFKEIEVDSELNSMKEPERQKDLEARD